MNTHPSNKSLFLQGMKASLPIIPGYWATAIACGAIGPVCGLNFWQTEILGGVLYAGSAQLVFCSLYAAHASIIQLILSVALINMRYLFMGTYIAKFFSTFTLGKKIISAILITDETFGISTQFARQNDETIPFYWLLGLNTIAWVNWVAANSVGIFLGNLVPAWANEALNFSLVGMFIGLLVLRLRHSQHLLYDYMVMATAIVATLLLYNYVDKHIGVIIVTILSSIAGAILYSRNSKQR